MFDIKITGKGAHGARPESGIDPVVVGGHIITALQSIVARNVSPHDTAVISVTQMHAGDAYNVIPESAVLRGTIRAFKMEVMELMKANIERISRGIAEGLGAKAEPKVRFSYPPLVNNHDEARFAADIAAGIVGEENVDRNGPMVMASEDFSYMLNACPGAFVFIGQLVYDLLNWHVDVKLHGGELALFGALTLAFALAGALQPARAATRVGPREVFLVE